MNVVECERAVSEADAGEEELHHAAHTPCQRDAEVITLLCGIVTDDGPSTPEESRLPLCPMCWNTDVCPRCGTHLVKPEVL